MILEDLRHGQTSLRRLPGAGNDIPSLFCNEPQFILKPVGDEHNLQRDLKQIVCAVSGCKISLIFQIQSDSLCQL
jgi:hypothetical protein